MRMRKIETWKAGVIGELERAHKEQGILDLVATNQRSSLCNGLVHSDYIGPLNLSVAANSSAITSIRSSVGYVCIRKVNEGAF